MYDYSVTSGIKDTLGPAILSFYREDVLIRRLKVYIFRGPRKVSFIEKCPLFGMSFISKYLKFVSYLYNQGFI